MPRTDPKERLGLSVPYDWWPAAPLLKEIEAAGFRYVQVPSPPPSVLTVPREATRHAAALSEALATSDLRLILHGPGSVRAGTRDGDSALAGPDLLRRRGRGLTRRLSRSEPARRAGERGRPAGRDPLAVGARHSSGAPRGDHRAGEPRPGLPGPRCALVHAAHPADDGKANLLAGRRALHRRRPRQHRRSASPHGPAGADRAGARPRRPLPSARQPRCPVRRSRLARDRSAASRPSPAARPREGALGRDGATPRPQDRSSPLARGPPAAPIRCQPLRCTGSPSSLRMRCRRRPSCRGQEGGGSTSTEGAPDPGARRPRTRGRAR